MRKILILLLMAGIIIGAGCSSISDVSAPEERVAQFVKDGHSPALAFQLNTYYAIGNGPYGFFTPLDVPLVKLGLTNDRVLQILKCGSLVNGCMPIDVDVPEWDEWLIDVDVPEWDEWLIDVDVPEWDEWLIDVDVPEWDEWLIRFDGMKKYRTIDWMDWAVYGPFPIVDVDVPEWDEWLIHLTLRDMAFSYDMWLMTHHKQLDL